MAAYIDHGAIEFIRRLALMRENLESQRAVNKTLLATWEPEEGTVLWNILNDELERIDRELKQLEPPNPASPRPPRGGSGQSSSTLPPPNPNITVRGHVS